MRILHALRRGVGLFLGGLVMSSAAFAQDNLVIYDDQLQSGWLNWSWGIHNSDSTDYVHSGTKSFALRIGEPGHALCFWHQALSAVPYKSVRFWINGGATGGQVVYAQAQTFSGGYHTAVPLAPLPKNEWVEYNISFEQLGIKNKEDVATFLIRDGLLQPQDTFYVDDVEYIARPASEISTRLTADFRYPGSSVDVRMFGTNVSVYHDSIDKVEYVKKMVDGGMRYVRFPGGFYANLYHWKTNSLHNSNAPLPSSNEHFVSMLNRAAALKKPITGNMSVNYGSGTAEEAADWVYYMNVRRRLGIKYWDIGNENNGLNQPDFHARKHDAWTYANEFVRYREAMLAMDPTIKVGAVVCVGENNAANGWLDHPATNLRTGVQYYGWTPVALATMREQGVIPDYVILHRYNQGPNLENDSLLLNSGGAWKNDVASIRRMLNDYLGPVAAAGVEIVCSEHNSVYANPGKQTTSIVNALFYGESFGQALQTEMRGLNWWSFRETQNFGGNNGSNLYGWRNYGSYGMVSDINDPYPVYYGAQVVARWAKVGDIVIPTKSTDPNLSAYTVMKPNGNASMMILNKSATSTIQSKIYMTGFNPKKKVTMYSYGKWHDDVTRLGYGSVGPEESETEINPKLMVHSFPPYSMTVLEFEQVPNTGFGDQP